jgi:DNA processing protein
MGRVLALDDADYPSLLRQVFEPPRFLAVRGRLDDDERLRVAVVGSRTTDHRSRDAAGELARGLAERGYCVVSGLARGVDTAAHEGALAVGGRTIAVLGTGLDVVYPAQNEGLARAIAESGALVSPFAPGTGPRKLNFPHRNKTIAGLCRAVVVVQAPERSGALITARLALHADRDVLAMPGPVGDARYAGSNRLLREGAAVCLDIGDVVAQIEGPEAALAVWGAASGAPRTTGLTEDERAVFESVATDAVHVDEIARACGLAPAALLPVLLRLELKGALRALPGAHFARRATIGALAAPPAPCRARG